MGNRRAKRLRKGGESALSHWQWRLSSHWQWVLVLLPLLALIMRVAYIYSVRHLPTFDSLGMDPAYHHRVALEIAGGSWLAGTDPFVRSPLYMYFLGILYKLFGSDLLLPRLAGALIGSINVLLILLLSKRLFGLPAALISGVVATFFWPLIFFDGELLTTSMTVMMGLIVLLLFVRCYDQPTWQRVVWLGVSVGIAAATRENYFPLIGWIFLFLVIAWRRLLLPAVFLVSALLAVSPVTLRNYLVLDDFVPITHYVAVNLYIGNNPYADGRTAVIPFSPSTWQGGVDFANRVPQEEYGRPVKPSEVSLFWTGKTLDYIIDDPGHFLATLAKKFFFIFDLYEYSNNKALYFFRDQSALLGFPFFLLFSNFFFIPLGLLGVVSAIVSRNRLAIPLYVILTGYIIGLSLGFINTRIRMPVTVMMIIFSGPGLLHLLSDRRKLIAKLGALAVLMVFLLAINTRPEGHWDRSVLAGHFTMGNAYLGRSDLELAESHFLKSVRLTMGEYSELSRQALADIQIQHAMVALQREDFATAQLHVSQSLKYVPDSPQAYLFLGNLAASTGRDPMPHYLKLIAVSPDSPIGYASIAGYYDEQNNVAQARVYLEKAKKRLSGSVIVKSPVASFIQDIEQRLDKKQGASGARDKQPAATDLLQ